nr:hypothetical protein [Tanacetum cinerariifolium]
REMMLLFEDASNGSRDDHMRKVIHHDIKSVKIADFGLSKLQHARR